MTAQSPTTGGPALDAEFSLVLSGRLHPESSERDIRTTLPIRRTIGRALSHECVPECREGGFFGCAVGAVYDRTFFVDSTKYARSQTAPTVKWSTTLNCTRLFFQRRERRDATS